MDNSWKETIVNASRPVRIAVTVALSMLALFLLVATIDGLHNWGHDDSMSQNLITVSGTGTATAIPDTATISFTASATAADVATAEKNMTATVDAALASIKAAGIDDKDVTTSSYNVSPHYTSPCRPGVYCMTASKASGYDVSESVEIKVHDTTKVSEVLGGLAKANVTNVSGPNFVVDDTQKVMQEARAEAIEKAEADAKVLAKQLGVRLGKVVSFDEGNGGNPQPYYKASMAVMDSAGSSVAPTIPQGQNDYSATVSITYEIK